MKTHSNPSINWSLPRINSNLSKTICLNLSETIRIYQVTLLRSNAATSKHTFSILFWRVMNQLIDFITTCSHFKTPVSPTSNFEGNLLSDTEPVLLAYNAAFNFEFSSDFLLVLFGFTSGSPDTLCEPASDNVIRDRDGRQPRDCPDGANQNFWIRSYWTFLTSLSKPPHCEMHGEEKYSILRDIKIERFL